MSSRFKTILGAGLLAVFSATAVFAVDVVPSTHGGIAVEIGAPQAQALFVGKLKEWANKVKNLAKTLANKVKEGAMKVANKVKELAQKALAAAKRLGNQIKDKITSVVKGFANKAWNWLKDKATAVLGTVITSLTGTLGYTTADVAAVVDPRTGAISRQKIREVMANRLLQKFLVPTIKDKIFGLIDKGLTWIQGFVDPAVSAAIAALGSIPVVGGAIAAAANLAYTFGMKFLRKFLSTQITNVIMNKLVLPLVNKGVQALIGLGGPVKQAVNAFFARAYDFFENWVKHPYAKVIGAQEPTVTPVKTTPIQPGPPVVIGRPPVRPPVVIGRPVRPPVVIGRPSRPPVVIGRPVRPPVVALPGGACAKDGQRVGVAGRPHIYLMLNGRKRHIPNPAVYNALFRTWGGVFRNPCVNRIPEGRPLGLKARLCRPSGPAVYFDDGTGTRRWVQSPPVMDKYHFAWNRVQRTCVSSRIGAPIGLGSMRPPVIRPPVKPSTPAGLVNLALRKPARQSSIGWAGDAARAVDGRTNGAYGARSVTHTQATPNSWWEVDLGDVHQIELIEIWNRTDCCRERLSNFHVLVSPTALSGPADLKRGDVWKTHRPNIKGDHTTLKVGATGRYVRVMLGGRNYLSLAEVRVLGKPEPVDAPGAATPTPVPSKPTPPVVAQPTPPSPAELAKQRKQNWSNLRMSMQSLYRTMSRARIEGLRAARALAAKVKGPGLKALQLVRRGLSQVFRLVYAARSRLRSAWRTAKDYPAAALDAVRGAKPLAAAKTPADKLKAAFEALQDGAQRYFEAAGAVDARLKSLGARIGRAADAAQKAMDSVK